MTTKKWFNTLVSSSKRHFYRYSVNAISIDVDGEKVVVDFHHVGQNASHDFYVGLLPDGRIVTRAYGETGEEVLKTQVYNGKVEEFHEPVYSESIEVFEEGEYPTYLGHL